MEEFDAVQKEFVREGLLDGTDGKLAHLISDADDESRSLAPRRVRNGRAWL